MNASEPGAAAPTDSAADVPPTLVWAVRLLFGEAVVLAGLTAYLGYQDLTGAPTSLGVAVALTVFVALCAAGVAAVARALVRRSAAARGPAIVVQILLLVVAYYLIRAGLLWSGIPLSALGVGVGVLLLAPPTTRALGLS